MRGRLKAATPLVLLLPAMCAMCACARSAEERHLEQMNESINGIQHDGDRFDGPDTQADQPKDPQKKAAPPSQAPKPDPRVVHLADESGEAQTTSGEAASALNGEDPDDTTPRPSIRVQGTPQPRGKHGALRGGLADRVEQTMPDEEPNGGTAGPPVQAGAPKASALDPEAKRAYDAALALVNQKQFAQALDAFAAFLVKWPDHPNADNAFYWRGECYFAQGDFTRAAEQFEGLIARFPLGNKVPDALLKLGICEQKLGNTTKAKAAFERIQREFPRSEAARRVPPGEKK
jgi:tol-pal system protein YbgF